MVKPRLRIAVPGLAKYVRQSGIGRVLHSLADHWDDVELVEAGFVSPRWPVLRNIPSGLHVPEGTDLVLLPQLTGASALRGERAVPAIVIVHDIGIVDCPQDREASDPLTRWTIRQSLHALRHADRIVAVSEFTANRLAARFPSLKARTSVVPNGVDAIFLRAASDREEARSQMEQLTGARMRGPVLTYVGSETPRKNVGVLIDMLAEIRRTHPSAQLWKVGAPGDERWRTRTLTRMRKAGLNPDEDVVFVEALDDEQLAMMYRAADVFVTASHYEGFGLPALEAMAVGTSVVASKRGALPEVVHDSGRVVEPKPSVLAEAVREALAEGQSSGASVRAASFDWAASAVRFRAIFDDVCSHALHGGHAS